MTTQLKIYPWRRVTRSLFQFTIGLAPLMPAIYSAATNRDPAEAAGFAATALLISAGITRVMAVPQVESFLQRFAPWLAARPAQSGELDPRAGLLGLSPSGTAHTFLLVRDEDETGVSGTGVVAEGLIFTDGTVAMRWLTGTASTAFYDSIDDVERIHGHGGKTRVAVGA